MNEPLDFTENSQNINETPTILGGIPIELLNELPKILEGYLDDLNRQKLAQIEFQKAQLEIQSKQAELQELLAKQEHEIRLKNSEISQIQVKSNEKTQINALLFKVVVYGATLAVFTYLSVNGKVTDILSTVFGISALSVLGLDVTNFLKNFNNRNTNNPD